MNPSADVLNLKIIQKVEPNASSILYTSRHVVLYCFENDVWERAGIEGALFLYRALRDSKFIILNRQKMNNFIQPLKTIKSIQMENDFLMFSESHGPVYGLWFFSTEELHQFCNILRNFIDPQLTPQIQSLTTKPKSVIDHLNKALNQSDEMRNPTLSPQQALSQIFNVINSRTQNQEINRDTFVSILSKTLKDKPELADSLYHSYIWSINNN